MRLAVAAVAVLGVSLACHPPPFVEPPLDPHKCNPYREITCAGGLCCPETWACCGFQNEHEPITCNPPGTCEDATEPPVDPTLGGPRKHRNIPQRRP